MRERMENIFKIKSNTDILEVGYLFSFAVYLVRVLDDTTLICVPWPPHFYTFMRIFVFGVVLLRVIYNNVYRTREFWVCVSIGGWVCLSGMLSGYYFLVDIVALMVGAINVSYKKILKVYVWCSVFAMGISILASMTGVIDNLVYLNKGIRFAFGSVYTTDFAARMVYLLLAFWVAYDNVSSAVIACIMIVSAIFIKRYCNALCSTIVLTVASISVLVVRVTDKGVNLAKISKWIDGLLVLVLPIVSVMIIALSYLYDDSNSSYVYLNNILSVRLSVTHNAFVNYGFKWFGTPFEMVGFGGSTVSRANYNFVDSSYCMILVRYGIVVLMAVYLWYGWIVGKIRANGQRKLLFAVCLVAIHSVIEHHYLEVAYNVFLILTFSCLDTDSSGGEVQPRPFTVNRLYKYIGVAFGGVMVCMAFPYILDYLRTVVSLFDLGYEYRNMYFIVWVLLIVFMLGMGIKMVMSAFPVRKCVIYFACIVAVFVSGNVTVVRKSALYADSVSAGSRIIEALDDNMTEEYSVFVDDVPMLYKIKGVKGLSSHLLMGNSFLDKEDVVLIADNQTDLYRLIERGYVYGEISEYEGIYTNSETAAEVIRNCGVSLVNYYSTMREVDIKKTAKNSSLTLEEEGSIILRGMDDKPVCGPYVTLYRGMLRVEYGFKYIEGSLEAEPIAKVRLTADNGQAVYAEREIYMGDFDENGYCNVILEQYIPDSENVEFGVYVNGDTVLELQGIRYGKEGG